ncbi:MAG: hypothetical protein J6I60_05025 [Bacteroidaceae bacterium]|nr:hypothetical protein [Bacteroidaceae bacterium]
MKRSILSFIAGLLMVQPMAAQTKTFEEAFPDPLFRAFVQQFADYNKDGNIDQVDINIMNSITSLGQFLLTGDSPTLNLGDNVAPMAYTSYGTDNNRITDLTGIEYFPNLQVLNLRCNRIRTLDLSKNTKLWALCLVGSQELTDLILPEVNHAKHFVLYTSSCPKLKELDFSKVNCTLGVRLITGGTISSTSITQVEIPTSATGMSALKRIVMPKYYSGTHLNLAYATELEEIDFSHMENCAIQSLNLNRCVKLAGKTIDVSKWKKLNSITQGFTTTRRVPIYFKGNTDNQPISMYAHWVVWNATTLQNLFTNLPTIQYLSTQYSTFAGTPQPKSDSLQRVSLYSCNLTKADLTKCPNLTTLDLSINGSLSEVNISGLSKLSTITINGNSITRVKPLTFISSGNPDISLTMNYARWDNDGLSTTLATLPTLKSFTSNYSLWNTSVCQPANSHLQSITMQHGNFTSADLNACTALQEAIVINNDSLATIDVTRLPALKVLYANNNALKSIDLTNNTELCSLRLYVNNLQNGLDLSHNTKLEYATYRDNPSLGDVQLPATATLWNLQAFNTGISSIDVSQLPGLKTLNCGINDIASIDLSNNPLIETLNVRQTRISQLDLSRQTLLKSLTCHNAQIRQLDLSHNDSVATLNIYGNHLLYADFTNLKKLEATNYHPGNFYEATYLPQTDTLTVRYYGGMAAMEVPAAMKAESIDSLSTLAAGQTPAIATANGKRLLIVDATRFNEADWRDGTVKYYYKTGVGTDSVMMGVSIATRVESLNADPVSLHVSSLPQAKDTKYYSTLYYSDLALTVPEGVEAYTYKVADGQLTVSHTYRAGDVIPAGQGVVVASTTDDTYTFPIALTPGTRDEASMLCGSDTLYTDSQTDYVYFQLTTPPAGQTDAGVGFWQQTAEGTTITNPAHAAYLKVPAAMADQLKGFTLDDIITAITTLDSNDNDDAHTWHTLDGRRLPAVPTQPGVYLRNGKKVIVNP